LFRYEDELDFIYRIVTQDETWVTPEDIQEVGREFRREDDGLNVWNSQGIIMIDYLEQGHSINGTYYADELRSLRQEIACKRRDKLTQGVLLLHDKCASSHIPCSDGCCNWLLF
jgi:hypothetical protein